MKKIYVLLFLILFIVQTITFSFAFTVGRVGKYRELLISYADDKVDFPLLAAIAKVESNFNENAVSSKNACGIMQLLPSTARYVAELNNLEYKDEYLFAPDYNVKIASIYLKYLLDKFDQRWAIVAYNAGETVTAKWIADGVTIDEIPYKESKEYLRKVERMKMIYSNYLYYTSK